MTGDDKGPGRPLEPQDARPRAQRHRAAPAGDDQAPGDPAPDGDGSGPLSAPGQVTVPDGVPWLVADAPLYIYDPEAGAAPARAYNPGDRVSAEMVERYGWHDQTHVPEWASAPPAPATESSEEHS